MPPKASGVPPCNVVADPASALNRLQHRPDFVQAMGAKQLARLVALIAAEFQPAAPATMLGPKLQMLLHRKLRCLIPKHHDANRGSLGLKGLDGLLSSRGEPPHL
jgi:hypothetical protein